MNEVVIVEAARSAFGRRNGTLAATHPVDLLGPVQAAVLERAGIESQHVGQVIGGCINQVGAQAQNVTRLAWLAAGMDERVAATSVYSACGSSQQALSLATGLVASGAEDVVLACGVESMSIVPLGSMAADGEAAGHGSPPTDSYRARREWTTQFEGAERIATKYGISRDESDALGLESQVRARRALDEGRFDRQIVPLQASQRGSTGDPAQARTFQVDEIPRQTSLDALAALRPVARADGIHTAGTSSQIADGASAVLLMSSERARALGIRARATIRDTCLVGCDPVLMLEGPIPATEGILKRQGMALDDIDLIEINEAFSSIVLAWQRATAADMDKVNPNGGAIALGHPLGATGCALVTKALHELERSDGELALVTMCCGGGLGTGTLLQRVS
jgi:acetyl-CoA C-acetyltransferase